MLINLTSAHPIFQDFQFPEEVVIHAKSQPLWEVSKCLKCNPPPSPVPEASLLFPDGRAYPNHYKLPPGTWHVQGEHGSWKVKLYKPKSTKHDKPWVIQLEQVTRIITTLANFKPPHVPPKLTLV